MSHTLIQVISLVSKLKSAYFDAAGILLRGTLQQIVWQTQYTLNTTRTYMFHYHAVNEV